MSLKQPLEIKENALFISDAHANPQREEFYHFLKAIVQKRINTSQLFLMGDMFDLLVGQISFTHKHYHKEINLLNHLSQKIDIFYLEGNHDFNLKKIFPNITIIPITAQPLLCTFHNHTLLLSHGDWNENPNYLKYSYLIRHPLLLHTLNLLEYLLQNRISQSILNKQKTKSICRKLPNFSQYIKQKIQTYDIGISKIDFVCEGHYHQNEEFSIAGLTYKNFSSFACDKSYYQITFTDRVIFKEVLIRG